MTTGKSGFLPTLYPSTFPKSSISTVRPASVIQLIIYWRPSQSESVKARRLIPSPDAVNCAIESKSLAIRSR